MTTTNPSLSLPPPKFNIDENDQNIELWTFRLPVDVPLSALQNATLDLTSSEGTATTTLTHNDRTFHLEVGTSQENEFFRVLLPKSTSSDDAEKDSDDDDDDDDDDESKPASNMLLYPSAKPFTRHINVLSSVPKKSEIELAPREGPAPVDPMRHAYAHVPQRTGLKRRWMPSGVPPSKMAVPVTAVAKTAKPTVPKGETPAAKKIKTEPIVVDTPDSPSTVEDKNLSKEERRALKAEKKAAKKAKKEAKKAKKAAKKAKKEKSED